MLHLYAVTDNVGYYDYLLQQWSLQLMPTCLFRNIEVARNFAQRLKTGASDELRIVKFTLTPSHIHEWRTSPTA